MKTEKIEEVLSGIDERTVDRVSKERCARMEKRSRASDGSPVFSKRTVMIAVAAALLICSLALIIPLSLRNTDPADVPADSGPLNSQSAEAGASEPDTGTVSEKPVQGLIRFPNVSFVSSVIDDKKKENVSHSEIYYAFESVTDKDLIYIEIGDGCEETCPVPRLDGQRIFLVEDGRVNLPWVISEAEKAFPGKTIKYHVLFDSVYDGDYEVENYGFVKQKDLVTLRNESMKKICEMFSCEVTYKTSEFGDLVCSPEVYLTKAEMDGICSSGTGFLFIALT